MPIAIIPKAWYTIITERRKETTTKSKPEAAKRTDK